MHLYRLSTAGSLDNLVKLQEKRPDIAADEVLIRIHAVSLNARDLMMVFGPQPYGSKTNIVPTSDGAGDVVACGSAVTDIAPGMRVVLPFRPAWLDGPFDPAQMNTDLGGAVDGVLSEYVAFPANAVVELPADISYEQGATLPCAGVTAWTALTRGASLYPGSTVLVLGTGGVSIFALQIAKAMGYTVIATTSSEAKSETLRALGADHIVNYVANPDWDVKVRELTCGRGVDRVVEVGGAGTLTKSMAVLAPEGEVALIGLLDNPMNLLSPLPLMSCMGVIRGISVGSRADLAALLNLMHGQFRPKIDKIFRFDEARQAFAYLASRKHVGKVVIRFQK
jgi:NADPH:quinone reductase-like Zn-dependent oxidoreductase